MIWNLFLFLLLYLTAIGLGAFASIFLAVGAGLRRYFILQNDKKGGGKKDTVITVNKSPFAVANLDKTAADNSLLQDTLIGGL